MGGSPSDSRNLPCLQARRIMNPKKE